MRGDVAREWISDVYDAIDYERVMAEADALAADAAASPTTTRTPSSCTASSTRVFVALIESPTRTQSPRGG